ncbi:peptide chain release factor 1 [Acetohalobium arabaticum]|uniref:Peptide chain release factor 1 n=1 Tax=Acetohalobium arabaticum (strain ATCC 49924 / DSM 5501 / Z-7288) TaxID=574087 RepID=D9QU00_ACEAZ|nr:peptide chain release factor 1 [Acetohalobium arabaticum]ADL13721.1 bacterial peptide chain release factor 1 (bRF-1) [Acetohalobium arabaticum DSM 5501]
MLDCKEALDDAEARYEKLQKMLSDPEVINNQSKFQKLSKEHAELKKLVKKYRKYKEIMAEIEEAKELLEMEDDEEAVELAKMELAELEPKQEKLEEELPLMLIPEDPNDEKNVIVEIRAGTGGDEAALFAGELYRMYSRYAEKQDWDVDIMSSSSSEVGGFKEMIFVVEGKGAYSRLKYESGVHRVQRVPETESSGRIHTSTATVAVLPEAEDVDIEINQNDLTIETYRSSGPGGQSVNTTDSAVRITHEPTGVVVSCQDEKSQHKNKRKAMRVLRSRIQEKIEAEKQAEEAEKRKMQIGSGGRSERIRTYNFPQGRITDHRINLTTHQMESILDGEIDELVDELVTADQTEKLEQMYS